MRAYVVDRRRSRMGELTWAFRTAAPDETGSELTPRLVSSCSPAVPTIVEPND
jgi:hypothetical protein